MSQMIQITCRLLEQIVYRLKQLRDPLMVKIVEQILMGYEDLMCDRLSGADPPERRKGLGQHARKNDPKGGLCRGRKVFRRGCRNHPRQVSTVFGKVEFFCGHNRGWRWDAEISASSGAGAFPCNLRPLPLCGSFRS